MDIKNKEKQYDERERKKQIDEAIEEKKWQNWRRIN